MEFKYIPIKERASFKEVNLYKESGFIIERNDGVKREFETLEEAVCFCKKSKGLVKVLDHITESNIFLIDGECVWFEDCLNQNTKYNNKIWRGIEVEEEETDIEPRRLSVYDVYSERELL